MVETSSHISCVTEAGSRRERISRNFPAFPGATSKSSSVCITNKNGILDVGWRISDVGNNATIQVLPHPQSAIRHLPRVRPFKHAERMNRVTLSDLPTYRELAGASGRYL